MPKLIKLFFFFSSNQLDGQKTDGEFLAPFLSALSLSFSLSLSLSLSLPSLPPSLSLSPPLSLLEVGYKKKKKGSYFTVPSLPIDSFAYYTFELF